MKETYRDREFVEMMIKGIVAHPDDVWTVRSVDEKGVLITVNVKKEDMGQIIGRMGETAKAIRHLARIIGMQEKATVSVKINEPEGRTERKGY